MARLSHNLHGMGNYDEAAAMARRGMALANELGPGPDLGLERPQVLVGVVVAQPAGNRRPDGDPRPVPGEAGELLGVGRCGDFFSADDSGIGMHRHAQADRPEERVLDLLHPPEVVGEVNDPRHVGLGELHDASDGECVRHAGAVPAFRAGCFRGSGPWYSWV